MPKDLQLNKASKEQKTPSVLQMARKRVVTQAALTMLVIVLTVVILFAMSAAWYTNIVHTNGLTFEVEAWGFDGEILTNNLPIVAGPGDEGLVSLEVDSDSNSVSSVSVGFYKNKMEAAMQQRIYFYVDRQTVRNGELMDRVYLNATESYTYRLFSQGKLTLTESVHNDAQLKWHWVYDVLGYYVQGTQLADGDVMVADYLRPIEYDYDGATMEYDEEIKQYVMKTVDGTMTMEEFLVEVSKTDGYAGTIVLDDKLDSGYYPVAVDEKTGKGVFAYLCSWAEIENATNYDTQLGQNANDPENKKQYEVTLTVSAQKDQTNAVSVMSLTGLKSALENGMAENIKLTGDITIGTGETLTLSAGQSVMIDLNEHKILSSGSDIPIEAAEGSSLTMVNGTIECSEGGTAQYGLQAVGAEVVLSDVQISGFNRAILIADSEGESGMDSRVRLVGCTIEGKSCAMLVYGNGDVSGQKTQLIIEDSTIHSEGITISGNGNMGNYGTDIQIINSQITSDPGKIGSAIYQPQRDSDLTIYDSTISGYTAVAIKAGTMNVVGSTIQGLGERSIPTEFQNSGFCDTGDAVYIETNYGHEIALNICDLTETLADGSTRVRSSILEGKYGYALQVFKPDASHVEVRVYSGVFNMLPDEALFESYLAEGSQMAMGENGTYVVTVTPAEAGGT